MAGGLAGGDGMASEGRYNAAVDLLERNLPARAGKVAFVDRSTPAYFTVEFDPATLKPRLLHMTAAAHFMTDRYVRFDSGPALRPPR